MESNFTYTLKTNKLGHRTIHFNAIQNKTEFLKHLLQILGMYNFLIYTKQDIWHHEELRILLTGSNGETTLHINRFKQIAITENKNTSGFNKVLDILNGFDVFNLQEVGLQKDVVVEY